MERSNSRFNRWGAGIFATACIATALVTASCGGGGGAGIASAALSPATSLSPSTLAFASPALGVITTAQAIVLANPGDASLSISSIAVSGPDASDFTQSNTCGSFVAAGASCSISVTFRPSAVGSRSAVITLSDNATGGAQTVSLSGSISTNPASVSPSGITFGAQPLGITSLAQAVTVTNVGNQNLSAISVAVSGANASDFTETNNCSGSVAEGSSCTISVTFKPLAEGNRTAAISVTDSAPTSPQIVELSGIGDAAVASISSSTEVFGNVSVGTSSQSQSLTVANSGNAPLTISGLAILGTNGGDFTEINNCGTSVAAGASCTIGVTFTPSAAGSRSATLVITDNAAGSPESVSLSGTGTSVAVSVSPLSLSFVSSAIGASSSAQMISLTNSGNAVLTVSSVGLTGTNASDFSETNNCESSLAAGSGCAISVLFKPGAAGARTAAVIVTDNATGSPQTVPLSGAVATTAANASPSSLTFSAQAVGSTSASQTVTLANTGNATLDILSVALSGSDPSDFAQTNNCGTGLTAGGNCTINVTFTPAAGGTRTASLSVADSATGSPPAVSLTGGGTAPAVSLSPSGLTFLGQLVGTSSSAQTVTLTNSGNSPLNISSIAVAGANASDFTESSTCGSSLAAGASCSVSLTFKPSASGGRKGSLSITDNAVASPQSVSLAGTGTSPVAGISPAGLTFGNETVGATSAYEVVTLANSGTAPLNISGIAFSGANSSDFAQTDNCGVSVAAGASCAIDVAFTPAAAGGRSAVLDITDNAPGSPEGVSLSGTGTVAVVSLSPSSLTFVAETVGTTSSSQVITLNNTGSAALNVTSILLTGADGADFAENNTCGVSVAAGGNCTVAVLFTPSASGTRVASLSIADSASGSPQGASLTGTGTQPIATGPTYYVDNCVIQGSDANNGTSAGTPWLTVNKVNTSTFSPGDSILFESTCTWREQLNVPSSGSAASPVSFGVYGAGAQPIMSGADLLTSWISELPLYYASALIQPNQVFRDNVRLAPAGSKAALTTGQWWWDSVNNRVYVYDDPSGHTMEASQRDYGVLVYGQNYVTVQGLELDKVNSNGIAVVSGSTNFILSNNVMKYDGVYPNVAPVGGAASDGGIVVYGGSNGRITGNTISYSLTGIMISSASTTGVIDDSIQIDHNQISYTAWQGIELGGMGLGGPTNCTVEYNDVTYTSQTLDDLGGLYTYGSGTGNVFRYNFSGHNGTATTKGAGIMVDVGSLPLVLYGNVFAYSTNGCMDVNNNGHHLYGNTCYHNNEQSWDMGELGYMYDGTTGITAENNIFVASTGKHVLVTGWPAATQGQTLNYNLYSGGSATPFEWNVTDYNFANYKTNSGEDANSLNAAPTFYNPAADQFWLTSGSPGIGAGITLGSPYNLGLLPGSSWPTNVSTVSNTNNDLGAFPYSGQ